ncbi:MAG: leucine-rich repeat domain-containing protein [Bacteroidales bacterium]|nr:leucine-rich repeat domain-containing protein [Bacteroidales bacterium]
MRIFACMSIFLLYFPASAANKNIVIEDIKFSINTTTKVAQVKGRAVEATKKWKLILPSVLLTDWGTIKVTSIDKDAFMYDDYLTSVTLSEYTETVGSQAFFACHNLSSVNLGNKMKIIGYRAFSNTGLKEVSFPSSLQIIRDEAFYSTPSLTRIMFDNNSKNLESIGKSAFSHSILTSVTIPGCIKEIGDKAFMWCDNLEKVTLLAGNGKTKVGEDAFSNNPNLSTLSLGNPGVESFGDGAFCGCRLEQVILPSTVRTVGVGAFWSNNIQFLKINEGLTTIMDRGFSDQISKGSNGVALVDIPSTVTTIGEDAFAFAGSNLQEVICRASVPPTATKQVFDQRTLENTPLSVQPAVVNSYRVANVWKDFHYIKGIGEPDLSDISENELPVDNSPYRWFDLNGREINDRPLNPGIYIKVNGSKREKVIIK